MLHRSDASASRGAVATFADGLARFAMRPTPEIGPERQEASLRESARIVPVVIADPVTGGVLAVSVDQDQVAQSPQSDAPSEDAFFSRLALVAAAALLAFVSLVPLERQHSLDIAAPKESIR